MEGHSRGAKAGPKSEAEFAPPREGARSPPHIRIAVLMAILMLTFYGLLAARQMMRAPAAPDVAGMQLTEQARLSAASRP